MASSNKWLMILIFAMGLASCESEVVPPQGPRPPLPAEQVKIYQKPPQKYERLALITLPIESTKHWEETSDATRGFDKLKALAAEKGGNGVLLMDDVDSNYIKAGALYKGEQFFVPMREDPPTAVVQAIYVLKE